LPWHTADLDPRLLKEPGTAPLTAVAGKIQWGSPPKRVKPVAAETMEKLRPKRTVKKIDHKKGLRSRPGSPGRRRKPSRKVPKGPPNARSRKGIHTKTKKRDRLIKKV